MLYPSGPTLPLNTFETHPSQQVEAHLTSLWTLENNESEGMLCRLSNIVHLLHLKG